MSTIDINTAGCFGEIKVDGVKLQGVVGAQVVLTPGHIPVVEVRLAATDGMMRFADGKLMVRDLEAPEALERALLDYLCRKYPHTTAVGRLFGGLSRENP